MQKTTNEKNQFLTEEEIQILKRSSSISGVEGQRAKALLLVNSGMTQLATGNEVGLTRGQVKYVVAKYGREGISAFQPSTTSGLNVMVEKTEKAEETEQVVKSEKKKKKKSKKSKPSDKKSQPQPKKMKKADKKKKKDKKKDTSKKKDNKKKESKKKDKKKKDKKKKK